MGAQEMTDRHSNEEFNFGSLAGAFADEAPVKKESAGPAKITRSNVKANAPAVDAVVPAVDAASAPALPPMPEASMPPMPEVQNPAQTGNFWGSAISAGLPTALATGLGLLGGAAYSKLRGGQGDGGQGLQAPPTVDEDLRQLKLAQEQAKLDAMYAKINRQQELHDINLAKAQPKAPVAPVGPTAAPTGLPSTTQQFTVGGQAQPSLQYGQVSTNAPTGAPSPVTPPAGPAATVEPKPMSEIERIRLETAQVKLEEAKAQAARNEEIHKQRLANRAAAEAKQSVEKQQKGGGGLSPMDKTLLNNQITAAAASDVKQTLAKSAAVPPAAPAPVVTTPVETTPPAPTAKQASNIKEVSLPSEWPKKGMNWLTSAYGIEGAKNFIDTYNDGKPFKSHDEMKAVYDRVMVKPSFSSIPKTTRQDRGIVAAEREQFKIVPGAVAPPSGGGGGGGGQMIRGGGGGATGIGRAGEEIHNLNPLKL
jgi:hypothetical protein